MRAYSVEADTVLEVVHGGDLGLILHVPYVAFYRRVVWLYRFDSSSTFGVVLSKQLRSREHLYSIGMPCGEVVVLPRD